MLWVRCSHSVSSASASSYLRFLSFWRPSSCFMRALKALSGGIVGAFCGAAGLRAMAFAFECYEGRYQILKWGRKEMVFMGSLQPGGLQLSSADEDDFFVG